MRSSSKQIAGYVAAVSAAILIALPLSWTPLATRLDNNASDWMFRLHRPEPWTPETALLAIDDASYTAMGGVRNLRKALAAGLERVAQAGPKVIAVDVILADEGSPTDDNDLDAAFRHIPNLVLPTQMITEGWEDPEPRFGRLAKALGHVHADPDPLDGISRTIPLERAIGHNRRWALSMEAFRLSRGWRIEEESPSEVVVGSLHIPSSRATGRTMRIRFLPPNDDETSRIPRITLKRVLEDARAASAFAGKTVFVGATAQSAMRDRLMTPYTARLPMPGVEIHAHAFETLARASTAGFLQDAGSTSTLLIAIVLAALAGIVFHKLSGSPAYLAGAGLLATAHALPHIFFLNGTIFSYFVPVATAWLSVSVAASYQYFIVRRQLLKAEGERTRYQQAIHFVAHELKNPLAAIQGSSEIIGKYNLNDERRKQMAGVINSESKRLSRMVQTFLDVERLSEGQMELKKEPFALTEMVAVCVERARALAMRKAITITLEDIPESSVMGDRELMEYAVYNLLSNAVKYSPAETHVEVFARQQAGELRLSVKDEGMGMDEQEMKNLFRKFYRTRKAEASGEKGTGIGLSLVDQIVTHHGGRMEVASTPGKGSCFTMVLPVSELSHATSPLSGRQ